MFKFDCINLRLEKKFDEVVSYISILRTKKRSTSFLTIALDWKHGLNPEDRDIVEEILIDLHKQGAIDFSLPEPTIFNGCCYFNILLNEQFNDWYAAYQKDKAIHQVEAAKSMNSLEKKYQLSMDSNYKVFLNKKFIISEPAFDGVNARIFEYLLKNPNVGHDKSTLPKVEGKSILNLHKVVDHLGFKGALKRAFFNVSKNSILLRDFLTKQQVIDQKIPDLTIGLKEFKQIAKPKKSLRKKHSSK